MGTSSLSPQRYRFIFKLSFSDREAKPATQPRRRMHASAASIGCGTARTLPFHTGYLEQKATGRDGQVVHTSNGYCHVRQELASGHRGLVDQITARN